MLSALASLGGGILNAVTGNSINDKMIDFAREQREYNSPESMVYHMRRAGLNPMTYGQLASTQSAGGVPQLQHDTHLGEAVANVGASINQDLNDLANRDLVSANAEKARQDIINSIDEQRRRNIETYDQMESNSLSRKLLKKNIDWYDKEKQAYINHNEAEISLMNARENLEREHLVTEHIDQEIKRLQIPIARSQIQVNLAQVKSALASAYAAYQQGNFAKAQKIYTESLTKTENELRYSKIGESKAKHAYMNVVYKAAMSDLLWKTQPAWSDESPFNNPSQWSNQDVIRFMDLLGKGKSIVNPLEGFDAGALFMQLMPK